MKNIIIFLVAIAVSASLIAASYLPKTTSGWLLLDNVTCILGVLSPLLFGGVNILHAAGSHFEQIIGAVSTNVTMKEKPVRSILDLIRKGDDGREAHRSQAQNNLAEWRAEREHDAIARLDAELFAIWVCS